ncbi:MULTISPECIES: hypothetical protein [Paraburkholderia]|uniref:hypothetical protein n=1 Tax=Paraburkholderia TaxID=1822464 RepID=UPI00225BEA28|nr:MULTISPECIES: hypothetical protein [Paraburkholderia]MCX4162420.1 hypothetical protein [Paraburkholderia megapolitana]MDN7157915.1 hypothetical protein [Paraburkholderia sp. CHISQ3]MDQ6494962.1 hypothetical protein [Paraburkholderia megapolitana]
MKRIYAVSLPVRHAVVAAFMLLSAGAHAATTDFTGRGVFHFESKSGCPLASTDQSATDCNRVALDLADVHAAVDTAANTIVFSSGAADHDGAVVGDVLLQGSGVATDGRRVPLSLHLLLRQSGSKWSPDIYVHAPVRGKFTDVKMDPYRVSVREGTTEHVVLTPQQALDVLTHPSLASRVAREFVAVRPSDAKNPTADDITIALGLGRLSKSVARASFSASGADADLNQTLASGTWTIEIEALSGQIPLWVTQRELFLFGLDDSALLQDLRTHGFHSHDKLVLGARDGKGYLSFNGHEEAFAGAAASGRSFMQDSFIGLILASHRDADVQRTSNAPRTKDATGKQPA